MQSARKEIVEELHKPARKNFPRRQVIVRGIDETFQADLVEMIPYAKENKQFKYILMVIDIFSKFAWAKPVKNKSGETVTQAMKEIFDECKRIPKNLHTDMGLEFRNKFFKSLMQKHNINHYWTFTHLKAQICERLNRTIKEMMWKRFSLQGNYEWISILDSIMNEYNNRVHRTIGMEPSKVRKKHEKMLLRTVYKQRRGFSTRTKFKVGDTVRVSKYKKVFEKGFTPNWSTELFKVVNVNYKNPCTYLLEDHQGQPILGRFYEYELQKTKNADTYLVEKVIRKRSGMVYVKWLGFPSQFNSWIPETDIV
jgi:ribulose bisphosphate carboxylase small subunit